jgi:organic radical activating enzyme
MKKAKRKEVNKMKLKGNLVIETTRNCNLTCSHCLRGDRQSIDIEYQYIENVITQYNQIDSITFSGGEPSLNTKAINLFISLCEDNNVEVGNFYIATNGTIASDNFLKALMRLYLFCSDNEVSQVNISNDKYHDIDLDVCEKLKLFRFVSDKYDKPVPYKNMLNEGYFSDNYGQGREVMAESFECIDLEELEEGYLQDLTLYLNCNGQIILGCDWSYEHQKDHVLCNSDENIFNYLITNTKKPL